MKGRHKLFAILVLALTVFTGSLNPAKAQIKNFSDWNVPPPPLPPPPGSSSKVKAADKSGADKTTVQVPSDVPAVSQPLGSPVQLPVLAAIDITAPAVNTPDQPTITIAGLPEIPTPDAPDAPGLPKQSQQDVADAGATELPLPESPELPPAPTQPVPSGQATNTNSSYLLTPEVPDLPLPTSPPFSDFTAWSTPAIPESETNFKLVKPTGSKAGGKGVKKGKSSSRKK